MVSSPPRVRQIPRIPAVFETITWTQWPPPQGGGYFTLTFQLSQPTISKHLKVLENAGLIEGGRDAQRRPRRLAPHAMEDIAAWIEPFRQQWENRLNNLDARLAQSRRQEQ